MNGIDTVYCALGVCLVSSFIMSHHPSTCSTQGVQKFSTSFWSFIVFIYLQKFNPLCKIDNIIVRTCRKRRPSELFWYKVQPRLQSLDVIHEQHIPHQAASWNYSVCASDVDPYRYDVEHLCHFSTDSVNTFEFAIFFSFFFFFFFWLDWKQSDSKRTKLQSYDNLGLHCKKKK